MNPLDKAIVIAAHPDDEILWFSSIVDKVDEIVVCFLDVDSSPECSRGRRESLRSYPVPKISCLELTESDAFGKADWRAPATVHHGLAITGDAGLTARYKMNFTVLCERLQERLKGYKNVYTHNPWGEYGHEEHVQIYRAVKELAGKMSLNLWFSNYVSNRSIHLMNEYLSTSAFTSYCLPTNKVLSSEIMQLYKNNSCWTWYEDYRWPDSECFILDGGNSGPSIGTSGSTLPLNFVKVWQPDVHQNTFAGSLIRSLRRLSNKFR